MESEAEVVVLVSERRGRKRSLPTAHPRQKQKRSQQTETLTRVRADKSVAASANGEQPLAGPLIIAAVIGHPLGRWEELCAPEYASGAQSVLEGPAAATGRDTGNPPCEDTKGLPVAGTMDSWLFDPGSGPRPGRHHLLRRKNV